MRLRYIDLTHGFAEGMPGFASDWYPSFRIEQTMTPATDPAGAGRTFSYLHLFPHNATHVDAPSHFFAGAAGVAELGLGPFIGPAVVADLSEVAPGEAIDQGRLAQALAERYQPGDRILIRTDHLDRHWGRPDFWHHSPYLTAEAAAYLVELGTPLVAVDFNPEVVPTEAFPVHRTLLGNGIPILEYVRNLGALPARCQLFAPPLLIEGVEAAPCRAWALVET